MQIKRLSHISQNTRDLEAIEGFYVGILGFEIAHEFRNLAGERYGFFLHAGGGTFLEFFQASEVSHHGNHFRHICFETDDIEAFADHVRFRGINDVTIKRSRTDKVLQFFFTDPDGTQIEIQQHDDQSALKPFVRGD